MSSEELSHDAHRGDGERTGATPRRGRSREWSDERIEEQLALLLAGRETWPRQAEFEVYGLRGLAMAVHRYGGLAYWAKRTGVTLSSGQDRGRYLELDARRDTLVVLGRLGYLPNTRRIRAEGFPRLASFIDARGGGARAWLIDCQASGRLP